MLTAQEADRTRIARELHDDIGQSLAVLKIQMLRAGQPVSGHPQRTHASLKDLSVKLENVIDKVGQLSHKLHSSELELLGLVVAVKNHCRECSEQLDVRGSPQSVYSSYLPRRQPGTVRVTHLMILSISRRR
jgi:signal transduction histidine kinase